MAIQIDHHHSVVVCGAGLAGLAAALTAAHASLDETPPGSFARPQQYAIAPEEPAEPAYPRQVHDMRWKQTLAFARLFEALGEPDGLLASALQNDPRAFVRRSAGHGKPHGRL